MKNKYLTVSKDKDNQKGQSIIEATVSVAVVALILVTLVSAVTVSIRNATFSKNKSLATKYVNEGLEAVRSIRDRNWDELTAGIGTYGLKNNGTIWSFNGISDNPDGNNVFTRIVTTSCTPASPYDACEITVQVSWISGSQTFNSQSNITLTKWKQ